MGASRNAVSEICAARALYVGDDIYINRTGQQFSTKKNTAPDESVSLAATRLFMCCLCSSIEQIASCVPSLHVCGTAETVKYFFSMGSRRSTSRISTEAWNWMCYMGRPLHSDQSFSIVSRSLKKLEASHNIVYVYLIVHGLSNPNASFWNL